MCPTETELIQLLAGELSEPRRDEIRAHLEQCRACAERFASLGATWDLLGQWQPQAPPADLSGTVLAAVSTATLRPRWATIAASLFIAAAIGAAAGMLAPVPNRQAATSDADPTSQVVWSLGLDALAGDPGGLAQIYLSAPDAPEEPS